MADSAYICKFIEIEYIMRFENKNKHALTLNHTTTKNATYISLLYNYLHSQKQFPFRASNHSSSF